jgi:hypothetical protein
MIKDVFKIAAALLPIGIKLFKDMKNAKDKKDKRRMRERLRNSSDHYDAIRRELLD